MIKNFKKICLKPLLWLNIQKLNEIIVKEISPREFKGIVIDIGSTCNARCPYCPRQEEGFTFKGNGLMSEEIFDTIYNQLKDIDSLKDIALYAFGEPLLNKNAGKYINKLAKLNKKLILSTNTTNMDKFTDDLMYVDRLQFSIEGWDKESYERNRRNLKFEETIEKLKNFNKEVQLRRTEGLKTPIRSINCLYTKKTQIEKFIKTWGDYVDKIVFTAMGPYIVWHGGYNNPILYATPEMKEECFDFYIPTYPRGCWYLNNAITINSNGKAVLCCCDFLQELDLGDYRDLKAVFNNKIFVPLLRKFILRKKNICSNCRMFFDYNIEDVYKFLPELKNIEQYETDKLKIIG